MSQLYKKMYLSLFNSMEDVMDYINREMVVPSHYDGYRTQEVFSQIQAALQKCEDIYVEGGDEEE